MQTQNLVTQQVFAVRNGRRDSDGPCSTIASKAVGAPRHFFCGVIGELVDFDPYRAGVPFEGCAVGCAFGKVGHDGARVGGAPLVPDELSVDVISKE